MIVDGRALAAQIIADIRQVTSGMDEMPLLTVFTCAPNFETRKFLDLKTKWAAEAGIGLEVVEMLPTVTLAEIKKAIAQVEEMSDGIIIQFPFPHLATSDLIALIPPSHDVDVMHYEATTPDILPPVVGAIDAIKESHDISFVGKQVVIIGNGRLVGAPASRYATKEGATVTVVTKDAPNHEAIATADIIVLGAGVPGLLTPDMVKEGVVVFDAGTSEEGGMLVGDADRAVAHKASLFTPVPGGIGPLTIAILLKNVLYLAKNRRSGNVSVV